MTPDEMDKLVQLQDITGIEDIQICRALLESKGWDLEATAREQLNFSEQNPPPPAPPDAPEVRNQNGGGRNRSVVPRSSNYGILGWGLFMLTLPLTLPLRLAYRTFASVFGFVSNLLGLDDHRRGRRGGPPAAAFSHYTTPEIDVAEFRRTFDRTYGALHPPFYSGSYARALDEAKRDLRFMLVYLHCAAHQDTDSFCRHTLATQELSDFVASHNILIWACSVDTNEGYKVSQALREQSYPFLALIVLRQSRMMVVGRLEGNLEPEPLSRRLEAMLRDNEAFVVAARAERAERHINAEIRQEQDAAFQESLRQDQEKERRKREAEEEKRREEEEERARIQEEADRRDRIRRLKVELVSEIPEEPSSTTTDNTVRVLIKLPGGQRLERRFLSSHSLKYLYYYVFCHPDSPDEFDITTNFPRKVLNCKPEEGCPEPPSFEEAGLDQSTMLFVNDLDA